LGARGVDRFDRARIGLIEGMAHEFHQLSQARVSLIGRMWVGWHAWLDQLGGWLV
jgi:hypothetical protein